jgi:ELWxxDGT repeat protein
MKYIFTFIFFAIIFNFTTAQTIEASLVELNFLEDSNPQSFTSSQNGFYFTATDGDFDFFGRELWFSDGTSEGTLMVKDIRQGDDSSSPSFLTSSGNTLYFTANDGIHGKELWKSDGTESGTVIVKDIHPSNSNTSGPSNLTIIDGTLYFSATNESHGYELWKSDGTEIGTLMVKDINPSGNSSPSDFFTFNNTIYFIANDESNTRELWKSDGTESGTSVVKNINPNGSSLNSGNHFMILNEYFYFYADNGTDGFELWKSDGTESGTSMVKDIVTGLNRSSQTTLMGCLLNDKIIFVASDGTTGFELWESDGTEQGTSLIKNIDNTSSSSIRSNNLITKFNNEVYFLADDGIHGKEIWKSDGTSNGTTLLKDINTGNTSVWIDKLYVDSVNNKLLFFTTSTDLNTRTLWVSDGSTNGTFELSSVKDSNISGLIESFVTINNSTILTGENEENGNELWITDGTINGTSFFADLNYSNSSNPSSFSDINGNIFFSARGYDNENKLYKSDGTINGTGLVKDINFGSNYTMAEINGIAFFTAYDDLNGHELWKSDGTESGTILVKDINSGTQSSMLYGSNPQEFTVINDILYFSADDGIHGFELWRSDGTESGTFMLHDLYAGDFNSDGSPSNPHYINGYIYYHGLKSGNERGFWKSDGTKEGTTEIDFLSDAGIYSTINNKLLIYLNDGLYSTDGTQANTTFLYSLVNGIPSDFRTTLNNEFYFATGYNSQELVKTDGTFLGTSLLYDTRTHPTIVNAELNSSFVCGNYMYFKLSSGNGIWRTNGITVEQVVNPDTADFFLTRNLTCYKNNLLYLAELIPQQIWVINDNLSDPINLDINVLNGPNFEGNHIIEEMGATNNNVYFRARTNISGNELYITNIDASTLSVVDYENSRNNDIRLVKLYPNPASKYVTIKSLSNSNIEKFELMDLTGKIIHKQSNKILSNEITYDTSKLNNGIYLIRVNLADGKIDNLKLLVSH